VETAAGPTLKLEQRVNKTNKHIYLVIFKTSNLVLLSTLFHPIDLAFILYILCYV